MPSTTSDRPDARWSPESPLLRGLVDDAALFPPAALPLPEALAAHRRHRAAGYAGAVGPFLLAASGVADLVALLDAEASAGSEGSEGSGGSEQPAPVAPVLEVVLVARPGADPGLLTAARDALRDRADVRVVGAELGWEDGWRDLGLDDLRLALELPRGEQQDAALADVRAAVTEGRPVAAKFRTGPTPTWPWPEEDELAAVLVAAAALDVPVKLTGGLHHAARGTYEVDGVPEENHGLLNVLVATSAAASGAGREEVAGLLRVRDAASLAGLVAAWTDATATTVRTLLTGYGCCTVTDPLGELADLGLLDAPTGRTP